MYRAGLRNEMSGRPIFIDKGIRSSGNGRTRRNERKKRYATKDKTLHIVLSSMICRP
jgi:hypothetical protein